jgi:hypothetical protein
MDDGDQSGHPGPLPGAADLERTRGWRRRARPIFEVIVNPLSMRAAPAALLVSFVMPPGGVSFSLCWFHRLTGLPCPGCGLTRSLASISHLHLAAALRFHPFGVLIYALAVGLTAAGLAGEPRRRRLRAWVERRAQVVGAVYGGLVAAFIGFGLVRLGLCVLTDVDWFSGI